MEAADVFPDPRVVELVEAAQAGDAARADRIVASGVPVDARGRQLLTPLLWVVAHGDDRAADILLHLGADLRAVEERGRSVMVAALMQQTTPVLERLLAAGGDPNERAPGGQPLLALAINQLNWDQVDALLAAGADIDAVDANGNTPILLLAYINQYEQVAAFIQRGAKLDVPSRTGWTLAKQIPRSRIDPGSPAAAWKERVRQMLRSRGIDIGDDG